MVSALPRRTDTPTCADTRSEPMRNLDEFGFWWPWKRPPVDDGLLAVFEKDYGVRLPGAYRAFLRHSNGGYSKTATVTPKGWDKDESFGVHFFGLLPPDAR